MRIVVTVLLDQLQDLLSQGPHIVNLCEKKDPSFIDTFKNWLKETESVLQKYRRPQVAEIAAIRAQLLSASHAVYSKDLALVPAAQNRRKVFYANAAILFGKALSVLQSLYAGFSSTREEAERAIRQMILLSLQKNCFYPVWNSDRAVSEKLAAVWQLFVGDKDLSLGARQVLSVVHYADALRILGETIDDLKL